MRNRVKLATVAGALVLAGLLGGPRALWAADPAPISGVPRAACPPVSAGPEQLGAFASGTFLMMADAAPTATAPAPTSTEIGATEIGATDAATDVMVRALQHYGRGRLALMNQDFAQAVKELRQAADLAPNVAHIWTNLGLALHDSGDVAAAAEALDRGLKLEPDDPAALYFRGRIARTQKDTATAFRVLGHLLEVAPKTSPHRLLATYHLAQLHQEARDAAVAAGRTQEATEHLASAVTLTESLVEMLRDPQPYFQRYADAAALFRNLPALEEILIRLYLLQGSGDKAIPLLTERLADRPGNLAVLSTLIQASIQQKDYAAAKKWARQIIDANPDDAAGYQRLGEVYRQEGNAKGVLADLETYHQAKPANAVLAFLLADLYATFGQPDAAAKVYREVLASADKTPTTALAASLKLASAELQAKRPVDALAVLADALANPAAEATVLVRAAQVVESLPDPAQVLKDAQRLVTDDTKSYAPFLLVGMVAEQAKRPDDALALYDKAIARQPKASIAYSRKADLLAQAGKHAEGLKVYETALAAGVDVPVIRRKMGLLLEFLNRPKDALEQYQAARQAAPEDKLTRYLLAGLYGRLGRIDDAEKELRSLVAKFPKEIQAYCQLAAIYVARGDLTSAETVARSAQIVDDTAQGPKSIMAEIRHRQKRYDEAETLERAILVDNPDAQDVRLLLSYTLASQHKYKDATDELRTVLAAEPDNLAARYVLAGLETELDDGRAAEKDYQAILAKQPDHAPSKNDLGYLWAERGVNLDKAEQMIREALQASPKNAAYLDSLGWVLYKQGRFEEAAKALEEAVAAVAPHALLYDHLGDAYWRLARSKDAAAAWESAAKFLRDLGADAKAGDLARVEKKVKDVQAGQEPVVAPLPAKEQK